MGDCSFISIIEKISRVKYQLCAAFLRLVGKNGVEVDEKCPRGALGHIPRNDEDAMAWRSTKDLAVRGVWQGDCLQRSGWAGPNSR